MEWLKNMSLKKTFMTITVSFLFIGILFSISSILLCSYFQNHFFSSSGYHIIFEDGTIRPNKEISTMKTDKNWRFQVLSILQIVLPVIFITGSLLLADVLFYRKKLKEPISILQQSARRIQQQDLDFTISADSKDELGTLCTAFETMRATLHQNNLALWHQMEERKRLNAAFAHDLRNPITVLKGSAKNLQKSYEQGMLSTNTTRETISLIAEYSNRIEMYIEAMSAAQKMEEIQISPVLTDSGVLAKELESGLLVLAELAGKSLLFFSSKNTEKILIDKAIVQNVAENLVNNALRYAHSVVEVNLLYSDGNLVLCVSDDGSGFSEMILKKGVEPFLRDDNSDSKEHFGMGLYISCFLCQKHGGNLKLENTREGAKATAIFSFFKT